MTFFDSRNEKAPRVSSRGLRCSRLLRFLPARERHQGPVGFLGLDRLFAGGEIHRTRTLAERPAPVKQKTAHSTEKCPGRDRCSGGRDAPSQRAFLWEISAPSLRPVSG